MRSMPADTPPSLDSGTYAHIGSMTEEWKAVIICIYTHTKAQNKRHLRKNSQKVRDLKLRTKQGTRDSIRHPRPNPNSPDHKTDSTPRKDGWNNRLSQVLEA